MSEAVNSEKTDVVAILLIHEGDQVRSILISHQPGPHNPKVPNPGQAACQCTNKLY